MGVDHSWVGDLVFRLTSPAGTTVTIINRPGGSGNSGKNFCQTLLDDDAADAISIGAIAANGPTPQGPPYTGTFKPANPLSTFDGENPNGTWLLTVVDAFAGDSGSVRAFSLQLTGFACCQTGCLDVSGLSASSGFVGNQVTITGSGFNGVTSVKFGDVAAAFTVNSNTSITTTVPIGARTAPIVLGKPGCVNAQTLTFTTFPAITLTPAALATSVGFPSVLTVNLGYAQNNGVTVTLASSNPSLVTVPASLVIPAGSASATFSASGVTAGNSATITATLPASLGGSSASAIVNRIGQGYEADVTPRPNGSNNGLVTITDWVQIGRFVAGLDPTPSGNEFQRADNAPRDTLGDGRITLIDWVQAGRYVAGVDAAAVAGGPTAAVASISDCGLRIADCGLLKARDNSESASDFLVKASNGLVVVKLNASGRENALSFSLNFDSSAWRFVSAKAGRDAQQTTVIVNSTESANGRLGVLMALPAGRTLRAGEREVIRLRFAPIRRNRQPLKAELTDFPVARSLVDDRANPLRN